MSKIFDNNFDSSVLPAILRRAKTLSKEECRVAFNYMEKYRPRLLCELGTQYGCSTRAFLEMSKWLGLDLIIHSWDVLDTVRCIDKKDFFYHLEDISGHELEWLETYKPDFIFFDCHIFALLKTAIKLCLYNKIDFMVHDMALYERASRESDNFQNFNVVTQWEAFLIPELIDKSLLTVDYFENNSLTAICCRERFGICSVVMKR